MNDVLKQLEEQRQQLEERKATEFFEFENRQLQKLKATEEAIREHLFLGTILLALAGETRYFHTLWRSARLVYDFMHTPAQQLYKQALPLF